MGWNQNRFHVFDVYYHSLYSVTRSGGQSVIRLAACFTI
jgi:hypothetical protein